MLAEFHLYITKISQGAEFHLVTYGVPLISVVPLSLRYEGQPFAVKKGYLKVRREI